MTVGIADPMYLNQLTGADQIARLEQLYVQRQLSTTLFAQSFARLPVKGLELANNLIRDYPDTFTLLPRLDLDHSALWSAVNLNGRPPIRWLFPLEQIGKLDTRTPRDERSGNILLHYLQVMQRFFTAERNHFQRSPWWLWLIDRRDYTQELQGVHPLIGVLHTSRTGEIFAPGYDQVPNKAAIARRLGVPAAAVALPRLIDLAAFAYHQPAVGPLPRRTERVPRYYKYPDRPDYCVNVWLDHCWGAACATRFIAHIDPRRGRERLCLDAYTATAAPISVIVGIDLAKAVR